VQIVSWFIRGEPLRMPYFLQKLFEATPLNLVEKCLTIRRKSDAAKASKTLAGCRNLGFSDSLPVADPNESTEMVMRIPQNAMSTERE